MTRTITIGFFTRLSYSFWSCNIARTKIAQQTQTPLPKKYSTSFSAGMEASPFSPLLLHWRKRVGRKMQLCHNIWERRHIWETAKNTLKHKPIRFGIAHVTWLQATRLGKYTNHSEEKKDHIMLHFLFWALVDKNFGNFTNVFFLKFV